MLYTHNDDASVRNIIETRIATLPNVAILDFKFERRGDCLKVGVLLDVDHLRLNVCSIEEFPLVFDKRQVLNWCDEIEDGIKHARLRTAATRVRPSPLSEPLPGSGLRGNWTPMRHHH